MKLWTMSKAFNQGSQEQLLKSPTKNTLIFDTPSIENRQDKLGSIIIIIRMWARCHNSPMGMRTPLKIGVVSKTKMWPGLHQVVACHRVETFTWVQMIWTQFVDNT
jgi:hypothetical protein